MCKFQLRQLEGSEAMFSTSQVYYSLVPRLLFNLPGKYSGKLPILFWVQYFENTVISRQLDCEFKSALVNSKLRDSLLVLLSIDTIAMQKLGLSD